MVHLSTHFTLQELTESEIAIRNGWDNQPDSPRILGNLYILASGLERCRAKICRPIVPQSGYRSQQVNAAVGGSPTSRHLTGLACDFRVPGMTSREVCFLLDNWKHEIGIRKLIFEGSWVHVDFPNEGETPLEETLTAIFKKGQKPTYVKGIA